MSGESQVLGKAIQNARKNAGLTQQQLCQQAELSYSTLAKIERGAIKTPSVFTVQRIAEVLGISMDGLLGVTVDAGSGVRGQKKTSKSGVKFLYLDVNGCLVHFFHGAFVRLSQETGLPSELIESAFWHFNDAVCRGDLTMDEFNYQFSERLRIDTINWTDYYMDAVEPIEEMHELARWASQHYEVGLLTNIMPGYVEKMIELGKIPNLKYSSIVDSSQVGTIKPEEDIYKIAQGETGVRPEEVMFVDDSRTNLISADRLGWKVIWFDDYNAQASADRIRKALEF